MTSHRNAPVYFLGIDGGGTGCRARLTDGSGKVLATATGGPANVAVDTVSAWASVMTVAEEAVKQAGLPRSALAQTAAGLGLAGMGQQRDRNRAVSLPHPFYARVLATDGETACLGAHGGTDGGTVITGTGSVGVALIDDRIIRIGGWGFPISDLGSGAWLGLEAVRHALLYRDGLAVGTHLAEWILAHFEDNPELTVAFQQSARPRDYAALAPLVLAAADDGDDVAAALLDQAGRDLGAMIHRLAKEGAPRLSLMGGMAEALGRYMPEAASRLLSAPKGDAMDGALILAHRAEREEDPDGHRQSTFGNDVNT